MVNPSRSEKIEHLTMVDIHSLRSLFLNRTVRESRSKNVGFATKYHSIRNHLDPRKLQYLVNHRINHCDQDRNKDNSTS